MKGCFRICKYLREQLQIVSVFSNILDRAEGVKSEKVTCVKEVITLYFLALSSKLMQVRVSSKKTVL